VKTPPVPPSFNSRKPAPTTSLKKRRIPGNLRARLAKKNARIPRILFQKEKKKIMAHKFRKRWVFTWNSDEKHGLPTADAIQTILNSIASEGVFQLEKGLETGREHYQGRFVLKGSRKGKQELLKLFSEIFSTTHLTLIPELSYDSSSYCEKQETRIKGPWYVGLAAYKNSKMGNSMTLKEWQKQLLDLMTGPLRSRLEDRKVIWIQDLVGGNGKSSFIKYLAMNEKSTGLNFEKLPFDRPDRIRSSVIKLSKKKDVDVYAFDFTRTQGVDTSFKDLFEVIEEIKNGYIVDVMYGNFNKAFPKESLVIIFTNENINNYKKYLSFDRWEPFQVSKSEGLLGLLPVDQEFINLVPFEQYLFTRHNYSND
jgi:hypothetical protein